MNLSKLQSEINGIDIYLLDQILKERYAKNDIVLDAGCGSGRNLKWFYTNKYTIYGVDTDVEKLENVKKQYNRVGERQFSYQNIDNLLFESNFFDHVICSAVLHFAENRSQFLTMFSELIRVLKPGGSLFIRMASNFGIEDKIKILPNSERYWLPDETERFLLTPLLLQEVIKNYNLTLLEPVKTTNVENLRCMTTLIFKI